MGTITADFSDETVVVTGGASGIGRETARRFGAAGPSVIVGDLAAEPNNAEKPTHDVIRDAG